jgi:hypothetical protein
VEESNWVAISAGSSYKLHYQDLAHLFLTQFSVNRLEIRLNNILLLIEDLQLHDATHESSQDFLVLRISNSYDVLRILARLCVAPSHEISIIPKSEITTLAFNILVI